MTDGPVKGKFLQIRTLGAINTEIESQQEFTHALRYRHNTLAPISSLPNEIIAAIFFLLRSPGTVGRPDIHLVLRVAHVCHLWREIALSHPSLWCHLNFTTVNAAGATEILSRAKMAPLYLEAKVPLRHWDDDRFLALQKELQTHISHIHHLRISAEHFRLHTTLEGLVSPAPTLDHLSLSIETCPSRRPSQVSVPDTLFNGITPRLSSLQLCNCNISWKSPLLKGLENLTLSVSTRPSLTHWLDALDEMPQLRRLVLDTASPITPRLPFDVRRTVTLPFLIHLDISASVLDCGLALAHLVLPALNSLYVTTRSGHMTANDMRKILPYVVQHAHGPQDTQPLQSVFISGERTRVDIVASPLPNIDFIESEAKLSARIALSITSTFRNYHDDHIRILDAAVAALPLDSLVTLTSPYNTQLNEQFWRHHAPRWRLLEHVHLALLPARGFRDMLLQDNGGSECPMLPSLTTLELIDSVLSARRTFLLCDALMKRVEQGVPLEVLDLRTCYATNVAVQVLGEIVADVWCPTELETIEKEESKDPTWDGTRGPFVSDDDSGEEYYSPGFNSYNIMT